MYLYNKVFVTVAVLFLPGELLLLPLYLYVLHLCLYKESKYGLYVLEAYMLHVLVA